MKEIATNPAAITRNSFTMIGDELAAQGISLDPEQAPIIERIIHSTADFEFAGITRFSPQAIGHGVAALRGGGNVVTDVNMIRIGISAPRLAALKSAAHCFVADTEARTRAAEEETTRSALGIRIAHERGLIDGAVVVIGNAPTALYELLRLVDQAHARPALVVGVPVGFVNVTESKVCLMQRDDLQWIATAGRKGGSPVAVAIVNALLRVAAHQEPTEID